jgi:hypothetical protein
MDGPGFNSLEAVRTTNSGHIDRQQTATMFGSFFSVETFLHVFPPLFGILLCLLSALDRLWITAKVTRELSPGLLPNENVLQVAAIANGAAALNIHLVNVILFFAGSLLAVFDWPSCQSYWPIVLCIVMFSLVLYDLIVTVNMTAFSYYDVPRVKSCPGERK